MINGGATVSTLAVEWIEMAQKEGDRMARPVSTLAVEWIEISVHWSEIT